MSGIAFYEFFSVLPLLFNAMFVRKKEEGYSICQDYGFLLGKEKGHVGAFEVLESLIS